MLKEKIMNGKTYLGIELGSTRIKAVLIDDTYALVASGGFDWENQYENGYWTYSLEDVHKGVKACFNDLSKNVYEKCGVTLKRVGAIGVSAMMHGYLAFDEEGNLLTPFRTWRNTRTEKAAEVLSELFGVNIPQRWSIAHLYQAILNNEEHVPKIAHMTTLSGYIYYLLTGKYELGIDDASGMFPISGEDYDGEMLEKFDKLIKDKNYAWNISDILPKVKVAGARGTVLSDAGAKFLDKSGNFEAGIPVCPPEGDAGTGMVATNAVAPRTGNVSAGTSIFSMLVLEKPIKKYYPQIDIVQTPSGDPVAMVHCNNCCGEIDAWVNMFGEFSALMGNPLDKSELYGALYNNTLSADADCGKITSYNYISGEHITEVSNGRPMYFRLPGAKMNLANFMKAQIYSAMATLKIGMDLLFEEERVSADKFFAHGGLFKVPKIAQQILADALSTPVAVMETAGEGGAWGMALLAAYMMNGGETTLGEWLEKEVFSGMNQMTLLPDEKGVAGFDEYMERYKKGILAEQKLGDIE